MSCKHSLDTATPSQTRTPTHSFPKALQLAEQTADSFDKSKSNDLALTTQASTANTGASLSASLTGSLLTGAGRQAQGASPIQCSIMPFWACMRFSACWKTKE